MPDARILNIERVARMVNYLIWTISLASLLTFHALTQVRSMLELSERFSGNGFIVQRALVRYAPIYSGL